MTKADSNALLSKLKSSLPKAPATTEPPAAKPALSPERLPPAQPSKPTVKPAGEGKATVCGLPRFP
jgi:hypothetical protein